MAEKPNNFGICECGDPSCKCKPGTCDCTKAPKDFLPKQDNAPLKDLTIGEPVNPSKSMEIPSDNITYRDKEAAVADSGKVNFAFWASAIERLQAQLAENIERMATETGTKFYSKPCSWKIGRDGMREVAYNYIEEIRLPIQVSGSMASPSRQMASEVTWDKKVVLSKHMDDKSAMLACQAFNEYLLLKK